MSPPSSLNAPNATSTFDTPAFPDGLHLSWIDAKHDLRIATIADIDERGTNAHSVIIRHGVRAAAWSHDGKIVAVDDGSSRTIVLYSRAGAKGFARQHPAFTSTHLPFAHTDVTGPIAPDSVHMLVTRYVGKRHDRPVLAIRNLHSGQVKTLQDTFRLRDSGTAKELAIDFTTPRATKPRCTWRTGRASASRAAVARLPREAHAG